MAKFVGILEEWVGSDVTVVNPESFKSTALGKGLTFQSYTAKLEAMGEDFIRLSFSSVKGDSKTSVEQLIPFDQIKRVSIWGEERLIHL